MPRDVLGQMKVLQPVSTQEGHAETHTMSPSLWCPHLRARANTHQLCLLETAGKAMMHKNTGALSSTAGYFMGCLQTVGNLLGASAEY